MCLMKFTNVSDVYSLSVSGNIWSNMIIWVVIFKPTCNPVLEERYLTNEYWIRIYDFKDQMIIC